MKDAHDKSTWAWTKLPVRVMNRKLCWPSACNTIPWDEITWQARKINNLSALCSRKTTISLTLRRCPINRASSVQVDHFWRWTKKFFFPIFCTLTSHLPFLHNSEATFKIKETVTVEVTPGHTHTKTNSLLRTGDAATLFWLSFSPLTSFGERLCPPLWN